MRDRRLRKYRVLTAGFSALYGLFGVRLAACAQPDANDNVADNERALDAFQTLTEDFKQLGEWDSQAKLIYDVVDRVWRENGWNSSADEFARRAVTEVSGIPPWDFQGRLDRMAELLGERYRFDDRQRQRLQSSIYAETGWFFVKNLKTVMNQTRETISLRAGGKPFTPDLVAQWTHESAELLSDARERVDRIARTMEKTMSPEQRRILQEDLESFQRRRSFVDQMRERWGRGEWRPEDWGLEHDPIQSRLNAELGPLTSQPAAIAPTAQRPLTSVQPHDETTWERYVREFIRTYSLDDAQRETALSILRELQERARAYRSLRRHELTRVAGGAAAADQTLEAIQRMFEELKARLTAIPTTAQRSRVRDQT